MLTFTAHFILLALCMVAGLFIPNAEGNFVWRQRYKLDNFENKEPIRRFFLINGALALFAFYGANVWTMLVLYAAAVFMFALIGHLLQAIFSSEMGWTKAVHALAVLLLGASFTAFALFAPFGDPAIFAGALALSYNGFAAMYLRVLAAALKGFT